MVGGDVPSERLYIGKSILGKKKGEPLGQLSRSSGCIYIPEYITNGMGGVTPLFRFLCEVIVKNIRENTKKEWSMGRSTELRANS